MKIILTPTKLLLLLSWMYMLPACYVTRQSGYEANKQDIAVNFRQHNLQYIYPPDTFSNIFKTEMIDVFDYTFLHNLHYQVQRQGFNDADTAALGVTRLKDCFTEFKIVPAVTTTAQGDSVTINYLQANLLCTNGNDPDHVFYSYAEIPEKFEVMYLANQGQMPDGYTSAGWDVYNKTAIRHDGFSEVAWRRLSAELASNTADNIDSVSRENFHKEHPAMASEVVTRHHLNTKTLGIIIVVALIVLLVTS